MSQLTNDALDQIMGFDPRNLDVFQEKGPRQDPNVYKTNPRDAKSDDGVYRSRVKVILNPFSPKESIVPQASYWLKSQDGSMAVRSSLSIGDRNCPLFKCWKRVWFQGDDNTTEGKAIREKARARAKSIFEKTESQWVLVQILEDENKPELVGQFKVMKLARDIYDKLIAIMSPSAASKKQAYPVMDYVIGLELNIEVQPGPDDPSAPERKQREISYSLSQFGSYATIIKTDGTQLLTDEETELVDNYVTAANDAQNGKTDKKRSDGAKKVAELRPKLRPIYAKVIEYVRENLKDVTTGQPLDIVKYCGYQPWDENTATAVNHFIEIVDAGYSPENMGYEQLKAMQANANAAQIPVVEKAEPTTTAGPADPADPELPF